VVYIFGYPTPLFIPGLDEICRSLYRDSDLDNYVEGSKTSLPFTGSNISRNSQANVQTFAEYIDLFTSIIPYSNKTYGKVKLFAFVLNPDDPGHGQLKLDSKSGPTS
jgi:hypothetical protein